MIEALGGRKFLAWVINEVVLLAILAGLVIFKSLTDTIFITWFAALLANSGIYVAGNASVAKAYTEEKKPEPPAQ
jgi:uncharacterized membrane protein YfbV (UPF0208 family)